MSDDTIYTTEVVTTVRFTVRHFDKYTEEQFMNELVPELINFDHMIKDSSMPDIVGIDIIRDVVENANQELEEYNI